MRYLSIYKDIMENYDNVDNELKNYYPKIILNIISVIRRGSDISGEKVNLYGLEKILSVIINMMQQIRNWIFLNQLLLMCKNR